MFLCSHWLPLFPFFSGISFFFFLVLGTIYGLFRFLIMNHDSLLNAATGEAPIAVSGFGCRSIKERRQKKTLEIRKLKQVRKMARKTDKMLGPSQKCGYLSYRPATLFRVSSDERLYWTTLERTQREAQKDHDKKKNYTFRGDAVRTNTTAAQWVWRASM